METIFILTFQRVTEADSYRNKTAGS